jgi:hypothetical protein
MLLRAGALVCAEGACRRRRRRRSERRRIRRVCDAPRSGSPTARTARASRERRTERSIARCSRRSVLTRERSRRCFLSGEEGTRARCAGVLFSPFLKAEATHRTAAVPRRSAQPRAISRFTSPARRRAPSKDYRRCRQARAALGDRAQRQFEQLLVKCEGSLARTSSSRVRRSPFGTSSSRLG